MPQFRSRPNSIRQRFVKGAMMLGCLIVTVFAISRLLAHRAERAVQATETSTEINENANSSPVANQAPEVIDDGDKETAPQVNEAAPPENASEKNHRQSRLLDRAESGDRMAWQLLVFEAATDKGARDRMNIALLVGRAPIEMPPTEQVAAGNKYFVSCAKSGDADAAQGMAGYYGSGGGTGIPNWNEALHFQLLASRLEAMQGKTQDSQGDENAQRYSASLSQEEVAAIHAAVDSEIVAIQTQNIAPH